MNSSRLLVLTLLFAIGMAVGRGNIGDTETQCIARYGQPFEVQDKLGFDAIGDQAASFNLKTPKGPLGLNITFLNGIDVLERMTNADASHDISEDQKQAILDSESAGLKWSKQATAYHTDRSDNTSGTEHWLRSDGANATCYMSGKLVLNHGWNEIDLCTRQYAAAQGELDRQDGAR